MRLLLIFSRAYPWQTAMMFIALLLAGVADSVSVSALLPLLSVAMKQDAGSVPTLMTSGAGEGKGFEETVLSLLHAVGLGPTIGVLLGIMLMGIVLKSLLLLFAQQRVGYTAAQVTTDLRLALLRSMLATRWGYFVDQPIGRLANAMAIEPLRASQAYLQGITVLTLLLQTCIYTTVAALVSWKATLASLGAGGAILFASHFLVKMSRRAGKRQTNLMKELSTHLADALQSVKPLKAMAREDLAGAVLTTETSKLNRALQKAVFSKAALAAIQEPMFAMVMAAGIFVALVHWQVPLTTILVLVLLLVRVLSYLGKTQKEYQKMLADESAFWSLRHTIEEAEQAAERSPHGRQMQLESCLSLVGIEVVYGDKTVLSNLSLDIPAGTFTTLIGPSGAGKTTVVDLIAGLVRPQAGTIFLDGIPMDQIDLRHWRRQIGYVPQENLLLHDTVLMNVTLGDLGLGPEDAETALRAAGAWEFVARMPEGIYTIVGERGMRLSGGQRQRIMIARALVNRPKFLILDEATTALDTQTEAAICAILQQLVGDMTILAVSHQPAMLEAAERVYSIQNGEAVLVVDRHSGPMAKSGNALLHEAMR
jgi:ATP-binding cassette subfamily C protein